MPTVVCDDGVRICYRATGGCGPAILMLQGLGLSGRFWFSLPDKLAAQGCRCLVVDNRGTGRSGDPLRPWGVARMADDALTVLKAEGVARALVVGISMGGMIAQHLALRHPERVAGLVLLATGPGLPHGKLPDVRAVYELASLRFVAEETVPARLARLLIPAALAERAAEILAGWPDALRAEAPSRHAFVTHLAAVATHNTGGRLKDLRCPTLVVTGDADRLMPPSNAHVLAERIPGAELVELPGVGHAIPDQVPDEVVRLIARLNGCI